MIQFLINASSWFADLQKAKENGNVQDLLQLSGRTAEDIDAVKSASPDGVKRISNYSLSSFFTRDMPQISNADGSYTISGVNFTKEELVQLRDVMKTATDSISAGVGKNINLEYRNYAEMALAENAVNQYAKQTLNEEQQNVVAKAMQEYNAGLEELQNDFLAKGTYVQNNYGEVSKYYGLSRDMTEEDAAALNRMKENLNKLTGGNYSPSKAGDATGIVQVATNKELIHNISNTFKEVDLSDKEAVSDALRKYQELMRPAYKAIGTSSTSLRKEAESFQTMLDKIMAHTAYKSIDFMI